MRRVAYLERPRLVDRKSLQRLTIENDVGLRETFGQNSVVRNAVFGTGSIQARDEERPSVLLAQLVRNRHVLQCLLNLTDAEAEATRRPASVELQGSSQTVRFHEDYILYCMYADIGHQGPFH